MSVTESTEKVNAAVRECIGDCFFSSSPTACLVQYMNGLRFRRGWTRSEIQEVRSAVIQILAAISEGENDEVPLGLTLERRF